MKTKLTPNTCYIAGLVSKSYETEKSLVGIRTSVDEIEQRFIEIAVKDFGIEPQRILIQEVGEHRHVFFYHSRVSKQLKDIVSRETHMFKKKDNLSSSYVAGMFDGAGHVTRTTITINPLSPSDVFMLENLGVHTKGNAIMNISSFIALIKGYSLLLPRYKF
jgi:hypothetical protein